MKKCEKVKPSMVAFALGPTDLFHIIGIDIDAVNRSRGCCWKGHSKLASPLCVEQNQHWKQHWLKYMGLCNGEGSAWGTVRYGLGSAQAFLDPSYSRRLSTRALGRNSLGISFITRSSERPCYECYELDRSGRSLPFSRSSERPQKRKRASKKETKGEGWLGLVESKRQNRESNGLGARVCWSSSTDQGVGRASHISLQPEDVPRPSITRATDADPAPAATGFAPRTESVADRWLLSRCPAAALVFFVRLSPTEASRFQQWLLQSPRPPTWRSVPNWLPPVCLIWIHLLWGELRGPDGCPWVWRRRWGQLYLAFLCSDPLASFFVVLRVRAG